MLVTKINPISEILLWKHVVISLREPVIQVREPIVENKTHKCFVNLT